MKKEEGFVWRLGMFVTVGLAVFVITVYFIGKQKNLFGSTFQLKVQFKNVSGLKVGNNVRFSGINVGTVHEIGLTTDTCVVVDLRIKKEMQPFIKTDSRASISSDGLMGDKVLLIWPGSATQKSVKNNDVIASKMAIEMEDVMMSMKKSVDNVAIITDELAVFSRKMNNGNGALSKLISDEAFSNSLKNTLVNLQNSSNEFAKFTTKMNNGKGALSKLVSDEKFAKTLDSTLTNLKTGTKGLSENMEAAKNSFLLKGYFAKKKKADLKKKNDLKKANEAKMNNQTINAKDSTKQ